MQPSALLVTMNRYRDVKRRLCDIKPDDFPGVHMRVELARGFEDIPPLLRSGKDLVALDGHGWTDGPDAYFGTGNVFTQFAAASSLGRTAGHWRRSGCRRFVDGIELAGPGDDDDAQVRPRPA